VPLVSSMLSVRGFTVMYACILLYFVLYCCLVWCNTARRWRW